jgi:hypothetical protein
MAVHGTDANGSTSGFDEGMTGYGVWGDSGTGSGVVGTSDSSSGIAGLSHIGPGVSGTSTTGVGISGTSTSAAAVVGTSRTGTGVEGNSSSDYGVAAFSGSQYGMLAVSSQQGGLFAISNGYGVVAFAGNEPAGLFFGNVYISGNLDKGGGGFLIDHPLDKANRNLRHSFVESPERKDLYDGVAVCDAKGEAVVTLPSWFESLNANLRYQLTPIGAAAPNLHVVAEVSGGSFKIAGGASGLKVSWQVTGVRQDAWAKANPLVVEEEKAPTNKGFFLHPEVHGQPADKGVFREIHQQATAHLARPEFLRAKR